MSKTDKTLQKVLAGTQDANIPFSDLCNLLSRLGFEMRNVGGSHKVFRKIGFDMLNLQPAGGSKAKPYQVRQVRDALKKGGIN